MKSPRRKLEKTLDKLWGSVGRKKAGCEVCMTLPPSERINYYQLHPHHVIGRNNKLLRWNLKNRLWLCPYHHTFGKESAHENPLWFAEWFKKNRPESYKYLQGLQGVAYKQWSIDELEDMIDKLKLVD